VKRIGVTGAAGFIGSHVCEQLLDRGYEIMYLPGVHVWHDKAMLARSLPAQHRSGVCNDFVFAFRRCPFPMVLWLLPGKAVSHLKFAVGNGLIRPCLQGIFLFLKSLRRLIHTREPVSSLAFGEFLRRSRVGL